MYNRSMIELQQCIDKEQWDEFVLENNGHPLQLWGWGQVKASHGWSAERYMALRDDAVVGGAQVLIRRLPFPFRSIAYIPRGISSDAEVLDAIALHVKKHHHVVAMTVEPNSREITLSSAWKKSSSTILSAETMLVDTTKSESDLLSDMAKKTRQYIRKSAAEGFTIRQVKTKEELDQCLVMYRQTAVRAKFNLHNDSYYHDVFQQMNDHSPIFAAFVDGAPIAFLWLAISADTAYELYGGVNESGQQLRANYALKWHAIRKVKEWGISEYDFGGLVAGGVSNFKQGWSQDVVTFAGSYDRPLSPLYGIWRAVLPVGKKISQTIKSIL